MNELKSKFLRIAVVLLAIALLATSIGAVAAKPFYKDISIEKTYSMIYIEDHPELCQMDQVALASYMRSDVTQLSKIDVRSHSVNQCVFALLRSGLSPVKRQ